MGFIKYIKGRPTLATTGKYLKATNEEATLFLKNILFRFPEEEISLAKLRYPTHNGIHCFEVHAKSEKCSEEVLTFIDGYLLGFSCGQSVQSEVDQASSTWLPA